MKKQTFFSIVLLTLSQYVNAQTESCFNTWSGVNYTLPAVFTTMQNATPTDTFYIAVDEPGASDTNDGKSATYVSGNHGPWKTLGGINTLPTMGDSIEGGDLIYLRGGIYDVPVTVDFPFHGSASNPVRIKNYPSEVPVFKGTFDSAWHHSATNPVDSVALTNYYNQWNNIPMIRFSGTYMIIDGLTFKDSHLNTILYKSDYIIMKNCKFFGSMEDHIKTTVETDYALLLGNDFTDFGGEAIDVFGGRNIYIAENNFHDEFKGINLRSDVTAAWAKGGADSVYFYNNTFEDLYVKSWALVLGGCCWNNWTTDPYESPGVLKPVGTNIIARGNKFVNVKTDSTNGYNFKAALSFQASKYTEASDNGFLNCDEIMAVVNATQDTLNLTATNYKFKYNTIVNSGDMRLYNLLTNSDSLNSEIDYNCVFSDGSHTCQVTAGNTGSYANFKSFYKNDLNGCEVAYDALCDSLVTSSELVENDQVYVFPNPSSGDFHISGSNGKTWFLYGSMGELIRSGNGSTVPGLDLKPGVYFVRLEHSTIKIIKQ